MGALSCFACFGGDKTRRLESPEPVRQVSVPSQNEKTTVSVPRKVSDELSIVQEEHVKDAAVESKTESHEAISTKPETSSLEGFKLELPPSPALETTSSTNPFTEVKTEEPTTTSSESPATSSRTRPPIPQVIRVVSSASSDSKPGSRGSSLKQVSTKATTPPQSPVDTEAKELPIVRATSSERQSEEIKAVEASSTPEKVDQALEAVPASPESQSESQPTNTKATEALPEDPTRESPSPPLQPAVVAAAAEPKSTLDPKATSPLRTSNLLRHRPSYENDTPITPLDPISKQSADLPPTTTPTTKPTATTTRPQPTRNSTAPAEPFSTSKPKSEKRKGRLSRFLSVSTKDCKSSRRESVAATTKEAGLSPSPPRRMQTLGEEKERGGDGESVAAWEKEIERVKVEGRKWREEGDNDSLFCY